MVSRGHGLLGRPLGGAGHLQMIVVSATAAASAVAGLVVVMVMVMVSGHVAGRGRVVQLRVELQRRRYLHTGGRVTAATVVTATTLQLVVTVRVVDGHHVVRGPAGPGRRVGRRRVGRPGSRRRRRVQIGRRRWLHRLQVVNGRLLLLVAPDRRKSGPVVLLVTVCRRRRQQ